MNTSIKSILLTAIIILTILSGCTSSSTSLPSTATSLPPSTIPVVDATTDIQASNPTETSTETLPITTTAGNGTVYEGEWTGSPLKFTVTGNKVTSELYVLKDCGIASTPGSTADINGNQFIVTTTPGNNVQVTITGRFDSETSASGTISATGGGCEMKTTWMSIKK